MFGVISDKGERITPLSKEHIWANVGNMVTISSLDGYKKYSTAVVKECLLNYGLTVSSSVST